MPINVFNRPTNVYDRYGNIAGTPLINTNLSSNNSLLLDTDVTSSPMEMGYIGESRKDPSVYIEDTTEEPFQHQQSRSFNVEDSAWGTFYRAGKRSLIPALAGIAGGALAVALLPVSAPLLLTLGAGLAGGIGASIGAEAIKETVSPTTEEEQQQLQTDIQQHPTAAIAGEIAPNLLMFSPRSPFKIARTLSTLNTLEKTGMNVPQIGKSLAAEFGIGAATGVAPAIIEPMVSNVVNNRPLTEGIDAKSLITGAVTGGLLTKPRYVTKLGMQSIGKAAETITGRPYAGAVTTPEQQGKTPIIGRNVAMDNDYLDYMMKGLTTPITYGHGVIETETLDRRNLGFISDKDFVTRKDDKGNDVKVPIKNFISDTLGDNGMKYYQETVLQKYKDVKLYDILKKKGLDIGELSPYKKMFSDIDKSLTEYLMSGGKEYTDEIKEIDARSEKLNELLGNIAPIDDSGKFDVISTIYAGNIMKTPTTPDNITRQVGLLKNIENKILQDSAKRKLQDDYLKIFETDKTSLTSNAHDAYNRSILFDDKTYLNSGIPLISNVKDITSRNITAFDSKGKQITDAKLSLSGNNILNITDNNGKPISSAFKLDNILLLSDKTDIKDIKPEDFSNAINRYNNIINEGKTTQEQINNINPYIDIQTMIKYVNNKYGRYLEGNKITYNIKVDDITKKFLKFISDIGIDSIKDTVRTDNISDIYFNTIKEISNKLDSNISNLSPESIYDLHKKSKIDPNTYYNMYNSDDIKDIMNFVGEGSVKDIKSKIDMLSLAKLNKLMKENTKRDSNDNISYNLFGKVKDNNNKVLSTENITNTVARYLSNKIRNETNNRNAIEKIADLHNKLLDNLKKNKLFDNEIYDYITNKINDYDNLIKLHNIKLGDESEKFLYDYLKDITDKVTKSPEILTNNEGNILHNVLSATENVIEGIYAKGAIIKNDNNTIKNIIKSAFEVANPEVLDSDKGMINWRFTDADSIRKFYDNIKNNLKADIEKSKVDTNSKKKTTKLNNVIDNVIDLLRDTSINNLNLYNKEYRVELLYNPKKTNINKDTKEISFTRNYKINYDIKGKDPVVLNNKEVPNDYAMIDIIKGYVQKRLSSDNKMLLLKENKPTANTNIPKGDRVTDIIGGIISDKETIISDNGFDKNSYDTTIKHNDSNNIIAYKTKDTDTSKYGNTTYSISNNKDATAQKFTIKSSKTAIITKGELTDLINILSNRIGNDNGLDTVLNMLSNMGYDTVVYRNGENDYRVITLDTYNTVLGEHKAGIDNIIKERLERIKSIQQQSKKGKQQKETVRKNISLFDLFKYAEQTKDAESFVKENKPNIKSDMYDAIEPIKQISNIRSIDELQYISEMHKVTPIRNKLIDEAIHISYDNIDSMARLYDVSGEIKSKNPEYIKQLGEKITSFTDVLKKKGYNYSDDISGLLNNLLDKNPVAADALLEVFSRGEAWNINYTGNSYAANMANYLQSKGISDVRFFVTNEEEPIGVSTKWLVGIQVSAGQDIPFHELSHRYISDATKGLFGKETMDLINSALKVFNGKEENLAGLLGYACVKRQYRSAIDNVTDDITSFNRIQIGNGSMLDYVNILSRKIMYEDYKVQTEQYKGIVEPLSIDKTIKNIRAEKGEIEVRYAGVNREEKEQARLSSAFYLAKQVRDAVREGFQQAGFIYPADNYINTYVDDKDMLAPSEIETMLTNVVKLYDGETINNPVMKSIFLNPKLRSLITDIAMSYGLPGRYLAKVSKRFFEVRDGFIGRFHNPTMEVLSKLSANDKKQLYDILRNERDTGKFATDIPENLKYGYAAIRDMLDQVAYYHRKYNIPIKDYDVTTGKEVKRLMEQYKQYFPDMINTKVLDEIVRNPYSEKSEQYKKDFIDYTAGEYVKRDMSKEKAVTLATEIFERIRESSTTGQRLARGIKGEFGALHERMGVGLPESWRVKDLSELIQRYTMRVSHDMALHNTIQVDPIARKILGISTDPWGKEIDITKITERLSKVKPELTDISNKIKESDLNTTITLLKTALEKLGEDKNIIFYDEQVPDAIKSIDIKNVYTEDEAKTIQLLRDYYNSSLENFSQVENLLSQIKELNTPNVQLLLRFLYRDLTHSEATFHAATSFTKSLMIGLKAKVRDIFNNVSLMTGYANVPGKDVLRAMTTTAKFLMDGSALEQATRTGFIKQGSSSVQEWMYYIQENGGDLTRILTTLRDLALRCTGTDKLEEFSRAFATSMAMSAVHINLINARNGSGRTQSNAIRFIEYYTGEKFNPNKRYTPDEISMAAIRLAQQTQGTYDARDLPAWMLEQSFISAMFTLSKWNISQMNRFTDAVLINKTGSALKMLFGSVIGGAIGIYLMEELFGKKSNISNFKDIYAAHEEKKKQMGLETSDYVRLGFESQYSLLAMLQWTGYCGVMCDVLYSLNSALRKQLPNTYGSPLYEQVTTILDSSVDMINAIKEGENPITVGRDFMFDMLRTQIQTFNALTGFIAAREQQILPDTAKQLQRTNKIIEYHKYRRLMGYPVNEVVGRGNRYEGAAIRRFKQAETPQEALESYGPAISAASQKVVYPEDAKRVMQGLSANAIPWSPSIGENEYNISPEFARYYMYIKNRYGEQRAKDFYMDYLKTREMNKVRKNMISGTPLGVLIQR